MKACTALFAVLIGLTLTTAVLADDWVATKMRGGVFVYADGAWSQIFRGAVVPDDRVIRTTPTGRVQFRRGAEAIEMGPDTQVQIQDRTGQKFTTVKQYYGVVDIEAEARNVQHFAVRTPTLAAVVKGTKFQVIATKRDGAVRVVRGHVAVEDVARRLHVTVAAGQSVETGTQVVMAVTGKGDLPIVTNAAGKAARKEDQPRLDAALVAGTAKVVTAPDGTITAVTATARELREAAKESRDAAKEAKKEAKEADRGRYGTPQGNGNSDNSNSGGNGNSGNSSSGGNGNSGNSSSGGNSERSNSGGNGNGGGDGGGKKDKDK